MGYESVKSILFALTAILIIYKIVLKNRVDKEGPKFLIFSLLITLVIFFTIEFEIHHILRAAYNIPNTLTYLAVSFLVIYYLIKFRNKIISSDYILLIISLAFLGIGGLIDLLGDAEIISVSGLDLFEELFSAAGALFWLLFFFRFQTNSGVKSS
jgi:uncharacterized membrane protein